jgi:hypothetical protein
LALTGNVNAQVHRRTSYASVITQVRHPAVTMRPFTLVTKKLYFGVDANRMRDASARVLARLRSEPPGRAVIRLEALVEDFRVSAAASRLMIDEMLRHGLLEQQDTRGSEYSITDKFRRYASAEIIEPLPRARAKMLLTHIADLAWRFNRRRATTNTKSRRSRCSATT